MKNIAIMASGSGTNTENIIRFFRTNPFASVKLVLSNKPDALVLKRAHALEIETVFFDRHQFYHSNEVEEILISREIDLIVLAGFLWLVPESLIKAFSQRIINIHPALLPKYGGKGMYGKIVHEAVISSGENESGISIHMVNEKYDEGGIIFQARCRIDPGETPDSLAQKVHELEYKHYPEVIAGVLERL